MKHFLVGGKKITSSSPKSSKVFISYSHDSSEHKERVLQLSNRLRSEGIDCNIDQYETSPSIGWPLWMKKQIKEADFVLVVCTDVYEKRFEREEETETGLGAKWESSILAQELYDAEAKNNKFIPVIFSFEDLEYIPVVLRGATHYNLDNGEAYEELYARLTGQKLILKPNIGKLRHISPRHYTACENAQDKESESTKNKQRPKIGELRTVTNKNEMKMSKDTQDKLRRKETEINLCFLTNDHVRHTWYGYRNKGEPFNESLLRMLESDADELNKLKVEIYNFANKIENAREEIEFDFLTVALEQYLEGLDLDPFIENLLAEDAIKEIDEVSINLFKEMISS